MNSKKVWKDRSGKYESIPTVWAGMGEKRRRGLRILPKDKGYFVHVTSRVNGQQFLFGSEEKRVFVGMMRQWADFSGLNVLTHCLMDNHFHVLLWVPGVVSLSHNALKDKLMLVWPESKVAAWEEAYQCQKPAVQRTMDAAVLERMGDLPEFMRVLKQSFTCWYNRTHDRKGTLWDARYRSVVVGLHPLALLAVSAYIDLNPLRAGLVEDPMNYAWSGYGAAMRGETWARKGIDDIICLSRGIQPRPVTIIQGKKLQKQSGASWKEIFPALQKECSQLPAPISWQETQAAYRLWLVYKGEKHQETQKTSEKFLKRKGMDPHQVLAEYEKLGEVDISKTLHLKHKSFTKGGALGSPGFLEELMAQFPTNFSENRKQAGKSVKSAAGTWSSLREVD